MAAYDYDSRNRQIQMAMPHLANEQSIVRYALDGEFNMISLTDPRNNKTFNVFDKAHRLIQNTHRLGGVSRYEYDDLDRVTKVVAPNGVSTHYTYDLLGRRLSEISADRGNLSYEYDLANNLIRSTDGRGIETRYTYDELERPTSKTFPGNPAEDVTFTYDTCVLGIGYLCDVTDESGQYAYEYDAFGNIVSQSKTELEQLYTTQYQYDNGDNLIGMTYPSGRTVTLGRDGVRRIASITTQVNNQPQTVISNQQYRGDNLMTQCTYGNGLIDTRTYDLQGRLRSQSLGNASNNIIDQRSYVYDVNANIIKRDSTPQLSDYQYDALDRLIGDAIDNDISHNHQYDPAHNRTSKGQEGVNQAQYTYQPLSNRLLTSEQSDSTPDESGFTRLVPRRTTYNHANRRTEVVELENDTVLASYIYNAKGQRTRKTTATGTTIYHYDLYGQLISETTDTGELIKDYIWNGMTPAAQIDNAIQRDEEGTIQSQTETLHYLHSDHLYTTRFITNNNRNIVWRWEGQAFGESAVIESDEPGDKIAFNLRFPGQYFDEETNSYYNYFRDYDASLGRYLQSDPIGLSGGINTYGYVMGNPLIYSDIFGLCKCDGTDSDAWDFKKLKDAYQGKRDMLDGKKFHPTALDAIESGGSCATRLSNAFNRSGYDTLEDAFRNTDFSTVGDGLGNRYIMGAANLAAHLGVPTPKNRIDNISSAKGKEGIIYFNNHHIDLFDGNRMVGNGAVTSNYTSKTMYFMEFPNGCKCK